MQSYDETSAQDRSRILTAVVDLAGSVQQAGSQMHTHLVALREELSRQGVKHSSALDIIEREALVLATVDPRKIFTGGADPGPGGSSPGGSSPGGSSPGGSSPGGSSPGGSSPGGSSPGGSSPGGSSPGGSSPGGSSPGDDRSRIFQSFVDLAAAAELVSIVATRAVSALGEMRRVNAVAANRLEQELRTLGVVDRPTLGGQSAPFGLTHTSPREESERTSLAPRTQQP